MPGRWDFECRKCRKLFLDVVNGKCDPEPVWPICCGERTEMLYRKQQQSVTFFEPFETTHFDGVNRRIADRKTLAALENRFNVVRVDDPDIRAEGNGFVKVSGGNRTYFDRSGRAMR